MSEQPSPDSNLRHPDLRQMSEAVEQLAADARELLSLSDQQLLWKPLPESWGVGECLEHLVITGDLYEPKLQGALVRGAGKSAKSPEDPIRPTFMGRQFLKVLDSSSTQKVKAPKSFRPSSTPSSGSVDRGVGDRYLAQLEDFAGMIRRADGMDLNRIKLSSPATFLIRFNLGECLKIQVLHQQRHLLQARRVTEMEAFPPA